MKLSSTFLYVLLAVVASVHAVDIAPAKTIEEVTLRSKSGLRAATLRPNEEPKWYNRKELAAFKKAHKDYIDVTDFFDPKNKDTFSFLPPFLPGGHLYGLPKHHLTVRRLIREISLSRMQTLMTGITSIYNRFFENPVYGPQSSTWVFNAAQQAINSGARGFRATVSRITHSSFPQQSIIVKIPGLIPFAPVTIIGAHLDSVDGWQEDPTDFRAPGADDDASGVINLLESLRILAKDNFKPLTPVEFHFYAGEEGGLRGSGDIARRYKEQGVNVKAMLQLDMTAFVKPGTTVPTIGLITDYTNARLNQFIIHLLQTYTTLKYALDQCGYGCSDHASWNRTGYPSAFPFEAKYSTEEFNMDIHSINDTTSVPGFSWTHSIEFTKLALSFVYEMGH